MKTTWEYILKRHCKPGATRKSAVLAALAAVGLVFGCGTESIVNPTGSVSPTASETRAPGTLENQGGMKLPKEEIQWSQVGGGVVLPGEETEILASRYNISVFPESLKDPILLTIKERNPGVVDVELGPHGTKFEEPVKLEINYAGTANDPSSPDFHGFQPRLFWWNPATREWETVIGTDDRPHRTYTVYLDHFSRYAMRDGTGGKGINKSLGENQGEVFDGEQQWNGEQQWDGEQQW